MGNLAFRLGNSTLLIIICNTHTHTYGGKDNVRLVRMWHRITSFGISFLHNAVLPGGGHVGYTVCHDLANAVDSHAAFRACARNGSWHSLTSYFIQIAHEKCSYEQCFAAFGCSSRKRKVKSSQGSGFNASHLRLGKMHRHSGGCLIHTVSGGLSGGP